MINKKILEKNISFGTVCLFKKNNNFCKKKKIYDINKKKEIKKIFFLFNKTIKYINKILIGIKKIFNNNFYLLENEILILKNINFIRYLIFLIKNNLYSINTILYELINNKTVLIYDIIKKDFYKNKNINIKDIENVCNRLLYFNNKNNIFFNNINNELIIIAYDFYPLYFKNLYNKNKIKGIIIETYNKKYNYEFLKYNKIPIIINFKNITNIVKNNDFLILNTIKNKIYINPRILLIKKHVNIYKKLNLLNK